MNEMPSARADWVQGALTRYETPLIRYAWRMTGDLETARDVVQDTFLKLCTADRDKIEDHLAPWLYRVCRNRALDVAKKEQRMTPLSPEQMAAAPSKAPPPSAMAEGRELEGHVLQAMQELNVEQQEIFRLKFLDQLSYKEISDVTGANTNRVRYVIHTALKALRLQLQPLREGLNEA
jgi:RNA polymerase sigma factor (sigma-70 family)